MVKSKSVPLPQKLDMVLKIMQAGIISFDLDKYSTPLLKQLRDKGRKRTVTEAFAETADALDDLELAPRVKRVIRRPPPMLTIYVRKETEKAYNAIFMEELTVENFKEAVSLRYGAPVESINKLEIRTDTGSIEALDDQTIRGFVDEDTFIITLDYDNAEGTCSILLNMS